MSGCFFDADQFKTSKFVITKVESYTPNFSNKLIVEGANYNISGNFTLKDVTKNITFPARIDLDNSILKAKGNFDIDCGSGRMKYGNVLVINSFLKQLDLQAKKES
jgi:polyisoprenoid-binding protein YceI